MKNKRIIKLMLTVFCASLILLCLSLSSSAVVLEGKCGDDLTWTMDSESATLEINGTGKMSANTSYYNKWRDFGNSVKHLVIGEGVEEINAWSFHVFENLETINVDPNNTFYFSTGNCLIDKKSVPTLLVLGTVNSKIPSFVSAIGEYAFAHRNINTLEIPDSIERIDGYAFAGCKNLKELCLPDRVYKIGEGALSGMSLESFKIPSRISSIQAGSFAGFSTETLVIPDTVTHIEDYGFEGITIKTMYIPDSIVHMGKGAFAFSHIEEIRFSNTITEIPEECFYESYGLKNLVLPDNIISIKANAFAYSEIESLYIPKNVRLIEYSAISTLKNLPTISEENPYYHTATGCIIDTHAKKVFFANEDAVIPDDGSVTVIGSGAFSESRITEIVLPDTITRIESAAFDGCGKLKKITLSENLEYIGSFAFAQCYSLEKITIPESVRIIDNHAFIFCGGLTEVYIPDTVESIDRGLFESCRRLETVHLPNHLTTIPENTFYECESLKNFTMPENVKNICDRAFIMCESLNLIEIPQNIEFIGDNALGSCNIKAAVLPKTLKHLGRWAISCTEYVVFNSMPENLAFDSVGFKGTIYINSEELAKNLSKFTLFSSALHDDIAINLSFADEADISAFYYKTDTVLSLDGEDYVLYKLTDKAITDYRFYDHTGHWRKNDESAFKVKPHTFINCPSKCDKCNYTREGQDHSSTSAILHDDESHWKVCDICPEGMGVWGLEAHTWDGGKILDYNTETSEAEMLFSCTVCAVTKTETKIITVSPVPTEEPPESDLPNEDSTPQPTVTPEPPSTTEIEPPEPPPTTLTKTEDIDSDMDEAQKNRILITMVIAAAILLGIASVVLVFPVFKKRRK